MSCLSQYLGDTPGIQVFLHSVRNTCASLCSNNLQKCSLCQCSVLKLDLEGEQSKELNLRLSSLLQALSSPWEMDLPCPLSPHLASCHPSLHAREQHVCLNQSTSETFPITQQGFAFMPESKGNGPGLCPTRPTVTWLGSTS